MQGIYEAIIKLTYLTLLWDVITICLISQFHDYDQSLTGSLTVSTFLVDLTSKKDQLHPWQSFIISHYS